MPSPPQAPLLRAAAALAGVSLAAGYAVYVPLCPNANGVPGVAAIGHIAPAGGGANNKFGLSFAANNHVSCLRGAATGVGGDAATRPRGHAATRPRGRRGRRGARGEPP